MADEFSEEQIAKLLLNRNNPKSWEYYFWRVYDVEFSSSSRYYDGFGAVMRTKSGSRMPKLRRQARSMKEKAKGCSYTSTFLLPYGEQWPATRGWRRISKRDMGITFYDPKKGGWKRKGGVAAMYARTRAGYKKQ